MNIYNVYRPDNKDLSLRSMNITDENCLIVGDFNSHSTSWGYSENNARGDEVEDWQTESNLILLNDIQDQDTFYSRRWLTTSTPDIAFATGNLAWKTERKVEKQLAGSDHRPIKLEIDLHFKPKDVQTFPRWNYKKADWNKFTQLSDAYTGKSRLMFTILPNLIKIKAIFKKKWEDDHSRYNKDDAYHYLSRKEQVIIFRLRTGHNRLRHHLYSKMRIGPTDLCPCGNDS